MTQLADNKGGSKRNKNLIVWHEPQVNIDHNIVCKNTITDDINLCNSYVDEKINKELKPMSYIKALLKPSHVEATKTKYKYVSAVLN